MQRRQLFLILLLLPFALALDITGSIVSNAVLNITALPPRSAVTIDYGAKKVLVREDGYFVLTGVEDGRHVLETFIPGYTVTPLVVTVQSETVHVQAHNPSRLPGPLTAPSLPYPLVLSAAAKEDYFLPPPGFNIIGFLKNPMVLMMLGSAAMMYFMPKMMANMDMDPEMAKEMADTRKKMQGLQSDWTAGMPRLSNMLAGASDSVPATTQVPTAIQQAASSSGSPMPPRGGNGGNSGKRGKRR